MTAPLDDVGKKNRPSSRLSRRPRPSWCGWLAKEQGPSPMGPDGLPKQLTKTVLETALNEEMTEHLGRCRGRVSHGVSRSVAAH
jgi:hypothetical protein